jgi:hypothetical protein
MMKSWQICLILGFMTVIATISHAVPFASKVVLIAKRIGLDG